MLWKNNAEEEIFPSIVQIRNRTTSFPLCAGLYPRLEKQCVDIWTNWLIKLPFSEKKWHTDFEAKEFMAMKNLLNIQRFHGIRKLR